MPSGNTTETFYNKNFTAQKTQRNQEQKMFVPEKIKLLNGDVL